MSDYRDKLKKLLPAGYAALLGASQRLMDSPRMDRAKKQALIITKRSDKTEFRALARVTLNPIATAASPIVRFDPLGGDIMKTTDPFYSSTRWKALRLQVLRRDNYTCCDCGIKALGRNRNGISPHVDHRQPRSERLDLQWQLSNLVVRCQACHNRKTIADKQNKPTIGPDGYPVSWDNG